MSEPENELYRALRSLFLYSVLTVVLVVAAMLIAFYWSIHDLIQSGKCKCTSDPVKQIHEQHVTLQPGWGREDTIRENLKREWEAKHDVSRMERTEAAD